MVNVYAPWPVGKPVPPGWERVHLVIAPGQERIKMVIVDQIPKEPGISTVKARHQMSMLRRIVMGDEMGLEGLAALAHAQWSGWMRHLFALSQKQPDGSVVIPAGLVARWERQMQTPYDKLPYDEQELDRVEGRRVLSLKWLDQEEKHVI